jgi:hypothetical protein
MSVSFRNVPTTELLACEYMCVGNEKQHTCLGSNNALMMMMIIMIIIIVIKIQGSLFSWRYNPVWLYFHSPIVGFSLLVFEFS